MRIIQFSIILLLSSLGQVPTSNSNIYSIKVNNQKTHSSDYRTNKAKKKKKYQCSDRKDNDKDGLKDYPKDPGCKSKRDNSEKNSSLVVPINTDLGGKRAFPDNNPWNTDISNAAVDSNSSNLIASIGNDIGLHPDFGTVYEGAPIGIPYVIVSGSQPLVHISKFLYADESDPGPYPIPSNAPIEGGANSDGDRHVIVIDKDNFILYELYRAFYNNNSWSADSGAIFDLKSNDLRPAGWTSADAAGLPIFPGLVRYDEVVTYGAINHALRFTCKNTRRAYVSPARHYASSKTDPNLPPMGMRVRLKAEIDISSYPANVQVILTALKKYGMFLADNGSNWYISGAPDSRWNDDELSTIKSIKGTDFEVMEMNDLVVGE
jgi:hypothetical protein